LDSHLSIEGALRLLAVEPGADTKGRTAKKPAKKEVTEPRLKRNRPTLFDVLRS
jgi:hypothetical protein